MEKRTDLQSDEYLVAPNGSSHLGPLAVSKFLETKFPLHNEGVDSASDIYVDLSSRQFFFGEPPSSDYSGSFVQLREALVNPEIKIGARATKPKLSKEEIILRGRWLESLVQPVTVNVLKRASKLELIPGYDAVIDKFEDGFAGFRRAIGSEPLRTGHFDNWKIADFVINVLRASQELDSRPNRQILNDRHALKPTRDPSVRIITGRIGSLETLYELAGYCNGDSWEKRDYVDWGIKFMLANDGKLPRMKDVNFMSAMNLCPAAFTFHRYFGSFKNYKGTLDELYPAKGYGRQRLVGDINRSIAERKLPAPLFEGVIGAQEKIQRYTKYGMIAFSKSPYLRQLAEHEIVDLCAKYSDLVFVVKLLDINESRGGKKDTPRLARHLLKRRRRLFIDNYMANLRLPAESPPEELQLPQAA